MKISYPSIAKLSDLDKTLITTAINNIITEIIELISLQNNIELDLGQFGKFLLKDKNIQFIPSFKIKSNQSSNKQTVQGLMGWNLKKNQSQLLSPIKNDQIQESPSQPRFDKQNIGKLLEKPFATPEKSEFKANLLSNKISASGLFSKTFTKTYFENQKMSPTRRYNRPDEINLKPEMLGAGTDPLAKNQDFSLLAHSGKELISAQFKKPPFAKIRFPPILDKFSRTLAAPICSQKYNLSVSSRIGGNFTEEAKRLYIDYDSKIIKVARMKDNKVNFTANEDLLQLCATLEEELMVVVEKSENPELLKRLRAKKVCYERYNSYIQNEIGIENVAVIKPVWITDILELIPADFQ